MKRSNRFLIIKLYSNASDIGFRSVFSLLILFLAYTSSLSCKITDMAGREITTPSEIKRIALLRGRDVYSLAMLLGDSLPDKLIAWGPDIKNSDYDMWHTVITHFPSLKNIPFLGDIYKDALDAEALIILKPDLVIADVFMKERGYKSVEAIERTGICVVYTDMTSDPVSMPLKSLQMLAKILKKESRGRDIVTFAESRIDTVRSRLNAILTPAPTVYIECGNLGPGTYSVSYGNSSKMKSNSSWGTLVNMARGTNIAAKTLSSMAAIEPEFLLMQNPSHILITGASWKNVQGAMCLGYTAVPDRSRKLLTTFTSRNGWEGLDAVKRGNVHSLFHGFIMHPFSFAALEQMAAWLYPDTFNDIDIEKDLREFHERFLPFPYSGTWCISLGKNSGKEN